MKKQLICENLQCWLGIISDAYFFLSVAQGDDLDLSSSDEDYICEGFAAEAAEAGEESDGDDEHIVMGLGISGDEDDEDESE